MLKQKAESTHRKIQETFCMCHRQQEKGGPENRQINFHVSKKRGVLLSNGKSKQCSPEKGLRKDWKVVLDNMVSTCAPVAKNADTLPSIIKTANGKTTYCLNLVQIQVTFASRRVHTLLPSTVQAGWSGSVAEW